MNGKPSRARRALDYVGITESPANKAARARKSHSWWISTLATAVVVGIVIVALAAFHVF
jgi:predicted cobalt transporter CbtA